MQHQIPAKPPAIRPVAIEVDGEPVGVVIPAEGGYRFLAVRLSAFGSDGEIFSSIEVARASLAQSVANARH